MSENFSILKTTIEENARPLELFSEEESIYIDHLELLKKEIDCLVELGNNWD